MYDTLISWNTGLVSDHARVLLLLSLIFIVATVGAALTAHRTEYETTANRASSFAMLGVLASMLTIGAALAGA